MKKTLLATLEYPPDIGGVASYYSELITQLPKEDIVVLSNHNSKLLPWRKSVNTIKLAIRKYNIKTILVGHVLPLGTIVALLSYFYPIQFIVFIHGMDITVPQKYFRKRLLLRWILRRASHIITVSKYTASRVRELTKASATPLTIIHPAAHIVPSMRAEGSVKNLPKNYILSVGRLVERKGFDKSIEAFARIHEDFPDVQYIIAGSGRDKIRLQNLISKYNLESIVQIRSGVLDAELAELYANCLFVSMPARVVNTTDFEGFGITVLEANMFSKPVIGGRDSGMTDAITDGVTGWLVNGTNVNEIAQVMQAALSHPERVQAYGKAASLAVSSPEASWKHKASILENIINSIGE